MVAAQDAATAGGVGFPAAAEMEAFEKAGVGDFFHDEWEKGEARIDGT